MATDLGSFNWPTMASGSVPIYGTFADFPAGTQAGDLAVAADTGNLFEWSGSAWQLIASPGDLLSLGAFGSTPNADGGSVSGNVLTLQPADGTHPGGVSITTQTIAGQKTFSTGLTGTLTGAASLNVLTSALGNFTDSTSAADGITVTGGTAATVGSVSIAQAQASASQNGYLDSTDWSTFNGKQASGSYITALTGDVTATGPASATATIASGAVTLAKMANLAADSIIGNNTGSPATPIALTAAQVNTLLGTLSNPMTTLGDVIYGGVSGAPTRLAGNTTTTPNFYTSTGAAGAATAPTLTASTGSGNVVLATSPTLVTPALGTPSALVGTNITGTASGLTAGNVTTNANLTGVVTSVGNATSYPTETANTVLAGPSSGSAAAPTFRALGSPDFPVGTVNSRSIINLGLEASVATSALTITLTQYDGSTAPTASAPVAISQRNATATTGGYNLRTVTSSINIVVPSGATLGQASAINQYVWVYALDNAGTIELAVSGVNLFQDNSIQTTTAISSGATSGTVLYSTTSRTSVPIRLVGRLLVNESTAGTWASAPTDVVTSIPMPGPTMTDWVAYTPTPSNFGTVSGSPEYFWTRHGDSIYLRGRFTMGSTGGSIASIPLPSGLTVDSNKELSTALYGAAVNQSSSAVLSIIVAGGDNAISFGTITGTSGLSKQVGTTLGASGNVFSWSSGPIPVTGWSTYGP